MAASARLIKARRPSRDYSLKKLSEIQGVHLKLERAGEEENIAHQLIEANALRPNGAQRLELWVIFTEARGDELDPGGYVVNGISHFMSENRCDFS